MLCLENAKLLYRDSYQQNEVTSFDGENELYDKNQEEIEFHWVSHNTPISVSTSSSMSSYLKIKATNHGCPLFPKMCMDFCHDTGHKTGRCSGWLHQGRTCNCYD